MARRRTRRKAKKNSPAWIWLLAGLVIGAGVPAWLVWQGWLPAPGGRVDVAEPPAPSAAPAEPALIAEPREDEREEGSRYDFFTVLPEMEVVVPEQQLEQAASEAPDADAAAASTTGASFLLQAGSFRTPADAERMKARLALLGVFANVQAVTVNGETWHRVRIGPVDGARNADDIRRQLADNGIDTLVMKAQ